MSIPLSLVAILLAIDGPVGRGIPPVVARFADNEIALTAIFARHPTDSIPQVEIDWFLDGGALAAPVGKSSLLLARKPAEHPILTEGTFFVNLPPSDKTETYRGLIRTVRGDAKSAPLAEVQLAVFPPNHFAHDWQLLAASGVSITLIGELPGLRDFFQKQGILFAEGDANDPGTINRNGLLVIDASDEKNSVVPPGLARATLVFAAPDRSWQSQFQGQEHGHAFLWVQRTPSLDFAQDPLAQAQFLSLARPLLNKTQP
jgi:hypothetical protein